MIVVIFLLEVLLICAPIMAESHSLTLSMSLPVHPRLPRGEAFRFTPFITDECSVTEWVTRVCARIYFSFATIFANQIFFCAIFSNLEPDFGYFLPKKSQVWGHFSQKMSSVFNPLYSGGLFYTH